MKKIQLLNESYEQLRRLHAMFITLEPTRFDSPENEERFSKLLRAQDRAFSRNCRRSDAWEAEFEMEWSAIIRERDLLLNSANAVDPVTSDCLCSDGIGEESDVTTNSGACAAPHAITPERTTTPEPESGYTSGQGGTYPGTCDNCGETYDDLDASRLCAQCSAIRDI